MKRASQWSNRTKAVAKRHHTKTGTCAYCGTIGPVTDDHVIPRGMFGRPLPSYLPVVPACKDCNNDKSYFDDYLRTVLVYDWESLLHPVAREIAEGKAARSLKR